MDFFNKLRNSQKLIPIKINLTKPNLQENQFPSLIQIRYKTSWNFSKFINIYNIISELNTREELREILLFLIAHSI